MKTRLRAKQQDTKARGAQPSILASKYGISNISVLQINKDLLAMKENKIGNQQYRHRVSSLNRIKCNQVMGNSQQLHQENINGEKLELVNNNSNTDVVETLETKEHLNKKQLEGLKQQIISQSHQICSENKSELQVCDQNKRSKKNLNTWDYLFMGRHYKSLREKRMEKQKIKRDAKISRIKKEFRRINSLLYKSAPLIGDGVSFAQQEIRQKKSKHSREVPQNLGTNISSLFKGKLRYYFSRGTKSIKVLPEVAEVVQAKDSGNQGVAKEREGEEEKEEEVQKIYGRVTTLNNRTEKKRNQYPMKHVRLFSYCQYTTPLLQKHIISNDMVKYGESSPIIEEGLFQLLQKLLHYEEDKKNYTHEIQNNSKYNKNNGVGPMGMKQKLPAPSNKRQYNSQQQIAAQQKAYYHQKQNEAKQQKFELERKVMMEEQQRRAKNGNFCYDHEMPKKNQTNTHELHQKAQNYAGNYFQNIDNTMHMQQSKYYPNRMPYEQQRQMIMQNYPQYQNQIPPHLMYGKIIQNYATPMHHPNGNGSGVIINDDMSRGNETSYQMFLKDKNNPSKEVDSRFKTKRAFQAGKLGRNSTHIIISYQNIMMMEKQLIAHEAQRKQQEKDNAQKTQPQQANQPPPQAQVIQIIDQEDPIDDNKMKNTTPNPEINENLLKVPQHPQNNIEYQHHQQQQQQQFYPSQPGLIMANDQQFLYQVRMAQQQQQFQQQQQQQQQQQFQQQQQQQHTPIRGNTQSYQKQVEHRLLQQKMTPNERMNFDSQTPPSRQLAALSPSPATVNQRALQPCEPQTVQNIAREQMKQMQPYLIVQHQQQQQQHHQQQQFMGGSSNGNSNILQQGTSNNSREWPTSQGRNGAQLNNN